jgi:hypothetical protein
MASLLVSAAFSASLEEPHDGGLPLAAFDLDEGQALGAKALRVFGHGIHLALRDAGQALGIDGFHDALVGHRAAEDLELAAPELLREIHQFHAEAGIRLVDAVAVNGFLKGKPLEGCGHVNVERSLPDSLQQAFDQVVDVLALDERHLDVDLAKLKLPVGALVFVAETAGDLVIAFDAADHEDLLELLGRLWQRVECPRLTAVRHEEFASSLRRALEEDRRFDLQEALLVHEDPSGRSRLAADAKVASHLRPAQIEVAILEPHLLIHLAGHFRVVHREGQHLGIVQEFEGFGHDFDLAGRDLRIIRAVRTRADFAGNADHALAPERGRLLEQIFGQIGRVKDTLGAPLAVAHVDENQAAEVAPGVDPAVEGDNLADVRRAQFIAMMRSFHVSANHGRQETESSLSGSPSSKAKADVARGQGDFKDKT